MNIYQYYVCPNPNRWNETPHTFSSYQEALDFALEHEMSLVEVSFSFEDSELVYEPDRKAQEDAIVQV
jgi:hypothetical protein